MALLALGGKEALWTCDLELHGDLESHPSASSRRGSQRCNPGVNPACGGRAVLESGKAFQLREPRVSCLSGFDTEKDGIAADSGYFWDTNVDISI
jgi:hypothetical protein